MSSTHWIAILDYNKNNVQYNVFYSTFMFIVNNS